MGVYVPHDHVCTLWACMYLIGVYVPYERVSTLWA